MNVTILCINKQTKTQQNSEPPTAIELLTFQIPVGTHHHRAMRNLQNLLDWYLCLNQLRGVGDPNKIIFIYLVSSLFIYLLFIFVCLFHIKQ